MNKREYLFWSKVDIRPSGCWEWLASFHTSPYGLTYGHFWDGNRLRTAHSWSYEHFIGPIPNKYDVDHLCRNTLCVNPELLEAVTHKVNVQRAGEYRVVPSHCPQGHEYTEANTYYTKQTGARTCRLCTYLKHKEYKMARDG